MLFASWILIKLDTNGEEGLGTNPIQCHDDVITDFTVGWLRTKNLVYTDIYMHFLFNLHASVCVVHGKHRRGVAPPRTALVWIHVVCLFIFFQSFHSRNSEDRNNKDNKYSAYLLLLLLFQILCCWDCTGSILSARSWNNLQVRGFCLCWFKQIIIN